MHGRILRYLLIVLLMGLLMASASQLMGEEAESVKSESMGFGIFANTDTGSIQYIDPLTNSVSPLYLKGMLGSYVGGLYDVVITSDGNTAIVSNFLDSKLFFIDISGGMNVEPTLLGFAHVAMFAEDMAITPDDKYVLVTDGGFSRGITVIEIATRTFVKKNSLPPGKYAVAVDITPDGQSVVVADYSGRCIHTLSMASDGNMTYLDTQPVGGLGVINVVISPDGGTLIVPVNGSPLIPIFQIDSQKNFVFKGNTRVPGINGQSCVFSSDGTKAYYVTADNIRGRLVHVLDVTGPGMVSYSGTSISVSPKGGTSAYFGVDTIALDPTGNYLYICNPTSTDRVSSVQVVDLTANTQVDSLAAKGLPVGIAFTGNSE